MQISKLNPIGYEAKTNNGNSYKKSNKFKTAFLAAGTPFTLYTMFSKNPVVREMSSSQILKDILGIKNKKAAAAISVLGAIIDIGSMFALGAIVDDRISKKRAKTADNQVNQNA